MESNPQLELAHKLIKFTGTNVFLTGKAGTGKTTFLHQLRENSPKRMIVVAPTGVAAINAKGVTIHSFFQLSFAPFLPGIKPASEFFRYSKEKINIIKSLDLLVIDEISMVRADLLDAVDYVLRHFRQNEKPFGGVQLLMIGDLEQLAPVVKDDEWSLLQDYYETPFFFESHALKNTSYASVELKTVFRQSDELFINMLNRIREKKIDTAFLKELNKRYQPDFKPDIDGGYIILTTHNAQAQRINSNRMNQLDASSHVYEAEITGNFPEYSYPTDARLVLKKGAQVMFVKNDLSPAKRYYNGKIAIITRLDDSRIEAKGKDDNEPIIVEKAEWGNMKYTIDPDTKELREEVEGSFEQYPLKTAWAITVHKSQGLTFEKAIIDANASFAHGQVYVALSRCRTLEGLVLSSPVSFQSVIRSGSIDAFVQDVSAKEPDEQQLMKLRQAYFRQLLVELFSFETFQSRFRTMGWLLNEYFKNLYPVLIQQYRQAEDRFRSEIFTVSEQFHSQLERLLANTSNPEEDAFLQERIGKASVYFQEKLRLIVEELVVSTDIETDNKDIRKRMTNFLDTWRMEIRQKQKTLSACTDGFSISTYLNTKSKAAIDEESPSPKKKEKPVKESLAKTEVPTDILNKELYEDLRSWRMTHAKELGVPAYVVLSQLALVGITNLLPQDAVQLRRIPGIGPATLTRYGEELLQLVDTSIRKYGYDK
ncbi:MAG: AAA family ATPase [Tannerella sp.]|nr:AAA family ATPase [Tannerella sp.]